MTAPVSLPWFVCVSPDYYDDDCDSGFSWEGMATSQDDAVTQALKACHRANYRTFEGDDGPQDEVIYEDGETIDPQDPSVRLHVAEPDFHTIGKALMDWGRDENLWADGFESRAWAQLEAALKIAGELP